MFERPALNWVLMYSSCRLRTSLTKAAHFFCSFLVSSPDGPGVGTPGHRFVNFLYISCWKCRLASVALCRLSITLANMAPPSYTVSWSSDHSPLARHLHSQTLYQNRARRR